MNDHGINRYPRCGVVLLVLAILGGRASAVLPNPVLNTVFPPGGSAGKTISVRVSGSNLDGLRLLHCTAPGVRIKQGEEDQFHVTIADETPPGLYDLRALCAGGVSSPRPFLVTNRTEQLEAEPNESPTSAQSVPTRVTINGRIEKGGDLDHFRFCAKRGQRIVVECWAERIDSRLRAVLEILDAKGKRLAVNRGYFGIDPLIDFRVPADGAYVVKVHDLVYSGSTDHYYRLDLDPGPRVVFAVPCVIQQGKPARVSLYGWNLKQTDLAHEGQVAKLPAPTDGAPLAQDLGFVSKLVQWPSEAVGNSKVLEKSTGSGAHRTTQFRLLRQSLIHDELDMVNSTFDRAEVEIPATLARRTWPLPVRLLPVQVSIEGFAYLFPGSNVPVVIGVTDVPVVKDRPDNHSPEAAQRISYPCEVSGQLVAGDERDWFAIDAKRGEVLYIEALGQRIHSPVDLDVSVLDASGTTELAKFSDEQRNIGGLALPSSHLDPAGRWVVPADGSYLIMIRNLIGGLDADPRRTYRLSVRREEPQFHLVAVSRNSEPAGLNISRGGRAVLDVFAFRRRGMNAPVRVTAKDLPSGLQCPDVWLGPGVNRAAVVITADRSAREFVEDIHLEGFAKLAGPRRVRGGVIVRTGSPNGNSRLVSQIPLSIAGDAALRITANGHETRDHHLYGQLKVRHSPGGILDVAVQVERRAAEHRAPVKLIGVSLPDLIENQTATIPAGQNKGYISFYLPRSLPVGRYSLVVRAETTVPVPNEQETKAKTKTVSVYSNAVNFDIQPPAFRLEVDLHAPRRIKRGETLQVNYTAHRINQFIGKIHTELAAPGTVTDVVGLRGRGVTFVGQTETGTIQIIANEDAPLGQQPFLRLYGVGVREDEPVFQGSCLLNLEVVE